MAKYGENIAGNSYFKDINGTECMGFCIFNSFGMVEICMNYQFKGLFGLTNKCSALAVEDRSIEDKYGLLVPWRHSFYKYIIIFIKI